jgi:hypothetical protein
MAPKETTIPLNGMRTLLICHDAALLDQYGMAGWLASFSDLVGIIVLEETTGRVLRRIHREIRRVGIRRFLDVLLFRLYYRLFLLRQDQEWEKHKLDELCSRYPKLRQDIPVVRTHSPNTQEAEQFIRELNPDIVVARCKTLLKESVFSLARFGAFVMHPGICPEYRNAHGCFWALAQGDLERVGMTLLRIDQGVDTGPVYGYFRSKYDEMHESHYVIQQRMVFDNLDQIQVLLHDIRNGLASPLDVSGRKSSTWGQPQFTRYVKWKDDARKRNCEKNES